MLNEEQGWSNGNTIRPIPDNMAVEEGLEVIVAMVLQTLLGKDGIHIGKGFMLSTAGLIIYHANLICTIGGGDAVQTVDSSSKHRRKGFVAHRYSEFHLHEFLESEDGERRQTEVYLEQLTDIFDDYLAVDNLQTVEWR